MKRTGIFFTFRAAAWLCMAAVIVLSIAGCLQVIGFEDRKDRIPPMDGGDDTLDWLDVDVDTPDTADGEDALLDPDMDGDVGDVPADDDAADVPADPDALDAAELPPGLVWVSIPAGTFEMGCSPGDVDCWLDELPRHTVNVSAFLMTETEITQAQYEWVMGDTPSYFTSCGGGCPVEQVDWDQAKAFCEAIGGRLPSEAEWEYAARAGTTTRYYCGDDAACLDGIAWYAANSGDMTHPVGEKTTNAFGLFDMLGNVWEWVEDCWHEDYTGAPSTGEVWSGGECTFRVLRWGSWYGSTGHLRVSVRGGLVPVDRSSYGGFRCARDST